MNILQPPAPSQQHVESTIQDQNEQIQHSTKRLRSECKQIVGSEENQDECEYMSESDITVDYDDDDDPDKTPSTDTGENKTIPVKVDHEEVIEPQNTDSNNGSKRKRKKRQDESNAKEKTNEWRELYRCLLELYIKLCIILTH